MTRYYCSYFDKNYLIKGIALIESLQAHERHPFVFYVVCLDELTRLVLEKYNSPNVVAIPLHQLEYHDDALSSARKTRTPVEYYWTLTPTVIEWLLKKFPQIPAITYLDADLYFFSSPDPIFVEFEGHSVLIHEHRFPPELQYLAVHGKYNVGLLCFRNNLEGRTVLAWWRERCLEWCFCRLEDGKFGDQLYLEDWPQRFSGVKVLEHHGAGVAPWNQSQYAFHQDADGTVWVNNLPLVFYHFHSFTFIIPGVVIPARFPQYNPLKFEIVSYCSLPYTKHLHKILAAMQRICVGFAFGMVSTESLQQKYTILVHRAEVAGFDQAIKNSGIWMPSPCEISDDWLAYNVN